MGRELSAAQSEINLIELYGKPIKPGYVKLRTRIYCWSHCYISCMPEEVLFKSESNGWRRWIEYRVRTRMGWERQWG